MSPNAVRTGANIGQFTNMTHLNIAFQISPDLAQLYQGVVVLLGTVWVCRVAKSPKKTWEHKYQTDISIHHINIYT